jgi:uncharacterized protein
MVLDKKLSLLRKIVSNMGSVLLAYSGGLDSTFLLKVLKDTLPQEKLLAVTANSATFPKEELIFAKKTCRDLGVKHRIIQTNELKDKRFLANTARRCYFCKKELFSNLKSLAARHKLGYVADGSSTCDDKDFRPGSQAKKELGVRSPLKEAFFSKKDIRKASKALGLITWDKPAQACLASRVAYHIRISPAILSRISQGERILRQLGFNEVRFRHHNHLCRIEVGHRDIPKMIRHYERVSKSIKKLGYRFVTLDLEGYRSGSMNLLLQKSSRCAKKLSNS